MRIGSNKPVARTTAAFLLAALMLAGCTTSDMTTGAISHNDPITLAELGVDSHGNRIGAAWPAIPHSNQVGRKGDQSRRHLQLGREAFRGDNFGMAERNFRKAVEIRPDSVEAWLGLAASYDQLGRFDLADRAYDQLVKLARDDARIVNNRGYSYLLRGDYVNAEKYLKKAQALNPDLEEVDGNLQLLAEVRST